MMNHDHLAADLAAFRTRVRVLELSVRKYLTYRGPDKEAQVLQELLAIRRQSEELLEKWGERLDRG